MSKISRRRSAEVRIGPDVRRVRKPVAAVLVITFIVFDAARLHLLHHLLGSASPAVAGVLFLAALVWVALRLRR